MERSWDGRSIREMDEMNRRPWHSLLIITTLAVLLRLLAIPYLGNGTSGNPVDVYYVDTEAAKLIANLKDPYLYSNFTNHFGSTVVFAYLPIIPIYFAPFALIGADIRLGSIVADVVALLAIYFIVKSTSIETQNKEWLTFLGPVLYALLPVSILLTSVIGSNMMIGSMFTLAGIAALFDERKILAGVLLGSAVATNQFVILVLPVIVVYSVRNRNIRTPILAIIVASAIILPFFLYSPSKFLYDVIVFQFERQVQQNGPLSLYYVTYTGAGVAVSTFLRFTIFLVPAAVVTIVLSRTKEGLLWGVAIISALGAFVLPVDGFWAYFLLPVSIGCALAPIVIARRSNDRNANPLKLSGEPVAR
jgi:uncharacterized membrane protein